MKTVLSWFRFRWTREVTPEQTVVVCRLLAVSQAQPVVIEAVGSPGLVEHRIAMPEGYAAGLSKQLYSALPGVAIERLDERPELKISHAVSLRLSTRRRSLQTDDPSVSRALLTALADVHKSEQLVLQWILARSLPAVTVPNHLVSFSAESWAKDLLLAPFKPPKPVDAEVRNALRDKQAEPGWQAIGRIGVRSGNRARERQLVRQLLGALGSAHAPGVRFAVRVTSPKRLQAATSSWHRPLRLNASELATVGTLPVGLTSELPINKIGSRLVPPTDSIRRKGRVIGRSNFPGRERPVAMTAKDSLRHVHLLGPTGVGKSTLLLHLISQDVAADRAVICIEPKGDLIAEILGVIPPERVNDVVVIDPADDQPVGLNPLALNGRSPELVADQLLGLWHSLYASSWGPRTSDILGSSLLTLARASGMTLTALPLLLTNQHFRRKIVRKIADPIGLAPFWAAYEAWSEQERMTAIAPSMNKLRPLLVQPALRALLGQSRPRFSLNEVFTQRRILLCNISKGLLGPEMSALLGALIVSQLWQAILGRSAIPPQQRHPVTIVVDEFADYLRLPMDFADALAASRGLGASWHLAHQYCAQLSPAMRSAVLANAQNRVAWRLSGEDARTLAAGTPLAPDDFMSLGAYEAYAQLAADDAGQPWCSIKTLPAPEPISDPEAVKAASQANYGVDRKAVEAELKALFVGGRASGGAGDDLRPRKRKTGEAGNE